MHLVAQEQASTGTTVPSAVIGPWGHAGLFLVAFLADVSRRPDAILNAQFWAEGGHIFYARAYEHGLAALAMPYSGYLNFFVQLISLLVLTLPLSIVPLVTNLCAIAIEVLPVNVFLSARFSYLPVGIRLLAAGVYLALPNSIEIHASLTNVAWHLALLAFLVLIAKARDSRLWQIFDVSVLVLTALSGPLGIILVPLAGAVWWRRGEKWSRTLVLTLLPPAGIQTLLIMLSGSRKVIANGASLRLLVGILGRQVFLATTLGLGTLQTLTPNLRLGWDLLATALGIGILGYAFWRGPFELKLLIAFGTAVLAAGLARPLASLVPPQWPVLLNPGCGNRYYFLLNLGFCGALIWIAWSRRSAIVWRIFCIGVLLALPIGIYQDWSYPPYADLHFQQYAQQFEHAPRGSRISIPINPPGWYLDLTKR